LVVETKVAKAEEASPCAQGCGPGKRPSYGAAYTEVLVAKRTWGAVRPALSGCRWLDGEVVLADLAAQ